MSKNTEKLSRQQYLLTFIMGIGFIGTGGLSYFASTYYSLFQEVTGFDSAQMGTILSALSGFAMLSYLFGGPLADLIHPKWNLMFAYTVSPTIALLLFLRDPLPSYEVMLVFEIVLAVCCLCPKWCSMLKLITISGTSGQVGRMFGLYAAFAALGGFAVGVIGSSVIAAASPLNGFRIMIIIYAVLLYLSAIALFFVVKADKKLEKTNDFSIKGMLSLLRSPKQWMAWMIMLGTYIGTYAITYLQPMLSDVYAMPLVSVTLFTTVISLVVGSGITPLMGNLFDKMGSTLKFYLMLHVIFLVGLALSFFTPWNSSWLVVALITITLTRVASGLSMNLQTTLLTEVNTPPALFGTATGFLAAIAEVPATILYGIQGNILAAQGNDGYRSVFYVCFAFAAIGLVCIWILSQRKKQGKV